MTLCFAGKTTDTGQLCQRIGGDVLDRSTLPMDPAAAQSPPSSPPSNRYAHSHAANGAFAPSPLAKASPSHAHGRILARSFLDMNWYYTTSLGASPLRIRPSESQKT